MPPVTYLALAAILVGACSHPPGATPDANNPDGSAPALADAAAPDTPPDARPPPCLFDMPLPPPPSVLWPAAMSATGAQTLAGHGHDDGHGPIGFCAGTSSPGAPFYRLVAAGVEVDFDVNGDGMYPHPEIQPDFWRDPATYNGLGESGGKVAVYIDVVDETGTVLNADSAPDIRVHREILDGPVDDFPLSTKPANEFQSNFPMIGGGARYGFSIVGASDRVINLRLPNNHHLAFMLVFQREPAS